MALPDSCREKEREILAKPTEEKKKRCEHVSGMRERERERPKLTNVHFLPLCAGFILSCCGL